MRYLLLTIVLLAPVAGAANAQPRSDAPSLTSEAPPERKPSLNLRLVQERDFEPSPVQHSGMIAHTQIMPNGTLGFGLLKTAPKKFGIGDERPDAGAPRSRKAAVSFRLKF